MSNWMVRFDEDEAVFQRPLADRLGYGALGVFFASLLGYVAADIYNQGAAGRDHLPLAMLLFFFFVSIFAFAAGPKEMRFDFRRQRYQWRMGFPLLSWTRAGDFSEIAAISVWNLKFTGLGVKWKDSKRDQMTFVSCSTGREAWALAEKIADKLGVCAEKGTQNGRRS